jgi:hypothetical protein
MIRGVPLSHDAKRSARGPSRFASRLSYWCRTSPLRCYTLETPPEMGEGLAKASRGRRGGLRTSPARRTLQCGNQPAPRQAFGEAG